MSDYLDKRKRLRRSGLKGAISTVKVAAGIFTQPDPARVLGIDTSHWTGIVDWKQARRAGIRFAIIKFLDGKRSVAYAEENYRGALEAGLLVGSYLWLRHTRESSPGGQAREYAALLKDHPVHIPPAIDFEWSPRGKGYNCGTDELYGFLAVFLNLHQRLPMIYTAPGYWQQYGNLSPYWRQFPLWHAQYAARPQPISPWQGWTFWQFTETGEGGRYGVPRDGERAVDLNYWRGSLPELEAWCRNAAAAVRMSARTVRGQAPATPYRRAAA